MTRRGFIALQAIGLGMLVSGCNGTLFSLNPNERMLYNHTSLLAAIDLVQMPYKKGLVSMEDLSFMYNSKSYVGTRHLLPWFVGAKIDLNKNDYFIKGFTNEDLLYTGYGIKDRLSLHYSKNRVKVISLGFENAIQLYLAVFDRVSSYSKYELLSYLERLEAGGLLNKEELLDYNSIKNKNNLFIGEMFNNYNEYEETVKITKESLPVINKKWKITINKEPVHISENDYLIYSFTHTICESILKNGNDKNIGLIKL